ncbi:MAG: hypothetical protein HC871_13655 [Rhizobiales bacterium]|nr:hypothetical protein [Hyphomicrobiales bacterium]
MTATRLRRTGLGLLGGLLALGGGDIGTRAEQQGHEAELLGGIRQLTFEGLRAGEGYFSADGSKLIFQSEREADNPFYQIYLMDLATGDTERVSPGIGKTTCAWLHPDGERLLFASTHLDPDAVAKQEEEFAEREKGGRRYSWSFDEHYDIFEQRVDGAAEPVNLTDALGYDAEGSYSPDGREILFASNRHAYSEALSPEDQAQLEKDPSTFMDLYVMKADGSDVRRLTDTPGYDGGPFFSADGNTILWRRFAEDGHSAEIYTANRDGTGERRITSLGAMSWAPFFHPSGNYVIFATSVHGFANFELYLVDSKGEKEPLRVTSHEHFDSLPVFSPDGQRLVWASARTDNQKPQLFTADWNDEAARALLGLEETTAVLPGEVPPLPESGAEISADDLRHHVEALASEAMEGRLTGSRASSSPPTMSPRRSSASASSPRRRRQLLPALRLHRRRQARRRQPPGARRHPGNTVLERDWRPLGMSSEGDLGDPTDTQTKHERSKPRFEGTYHVQVGAFLSQAEAEARAERGPQHR